MINIQYNMLFSIELLHKYFSDEACPDFIMQPTTLTASLLQGCKMVAKQYKHQLYAGIETDGANIPTVLPAGGAAFTFFLTLNNPLFVNYTNLFSLPQNAVYYFTNRNINGSNGKAFVSSPTPYNNTKTYQPDEISVNGAGTTFRAVRSSTAITPANGPDWMEVDADHYVSQNDLLPVLPSLSTYVFSSPQSSATIDVRGYNAAANDYSAQVFFKTISFINNPASFTLDLSSLPPGKYTVKVNSDAGRTVYINDEWQLSKAFAVIDLYNDSTLPDAYRLMDGTTLRSPLFSLSFLNRATIWKYLLMSTSAAITDMAGLYQFSNSSPKIVLSESPIPLREAALKLKLSVGSQDYLPIACASSQRLTKFNTGTDVYTCSEIFLNY